VKYTDIELTDSEIEAITKYKSFGEKWIEYALNSKKAQNYLGTYCSLVVEKTHSKKLGNCYYGGTDVYRRQDGAAITENDLLALKQIYKGQENVYTISDDGTEMRHAWKCDSSD
jgi:hypothetical protein